MQRIRARHFTAQYGMVLITTLLLLLVVTILALAMFRGIGLEGRIAGNVLDKQRAVQAADSAQQYAEQWLLANVSSTPNVDCAASPPPASTSPPQICGAPLSQDVANGQVGTVPWAIGKVTSVGFSYNPGSITTSTSG